MTTLDKLPVDIRTWLTKWGGRVGRLANVGDPLAQQIRSLYDAIMRAGDRVRPEQVDDMRGLIDRFDEVWGL